MSTDNAKMQQMEVMLKKSLITIKKLESELSTARKHEPIAIIGMGCRMPGGVNSPEDLWKMLEAKEDAISLIPKDRWDREATYDADPLTPGKCNTKHGAFLENDVRQFDADFFGIPPREARSMDPVQRLILEVTHETFEKSGIAPSSLRGSNTGVYLGIGSSLDYAQASLRSGVLENVSVYDTTGIPLATASGRISYQYDLQGPSFSIDAACSSSIVAIHLATEGLRNGECNLAVAGSANLLLTPELFVGLTKMGSLSPDGKCRAFDDEGNGYVRGEGCGVVILKRLKDALQDGDDIQAVIKGSAIVHDGLSNGFTAPNPDAQVKVINAALTNAAVDPATVDFVESHGVGNKFTDALELQALEKGYGKRTGKLYVGSVKPNIGHMEAAIGMAMLAKVIGAFKHRMIPPNINFDKPNSDINWSGSKITVPTEMVAWNKEAPLRASVHSSGYSGTNTHLVLEAPPQASTDHVKDLLEWPAYPVSLSAYTSDGLRDLVATYLDESNSLWNHQLKDISYTLAKGRSGYDHKLSVSAPDKASLKEALTAWYAEGKHKLVKQSDPEMVRNREIAMLFTGQGAQYPGMCKELYETNQIFKKEVDYCNKILEQHLGRSIVEIMYGDDQESINQTQFTQPALFVVEYALYKLWQHWGIKPTAVAGHSVGEYVALTVAGILKLEDALALIAARGKYIQSLPEGIGGMAAVLAGEDVVKGYLKDSKVDIAAVNSPKSLTISGRKEDVAAIVASMKEDKIKAIPLTVSHAFHSYLMEDILKDFEQVVAAVSLNEPLIPVISNVTGKELLLSDLSPRYFSGHIRGTVRFSDDIRFLDESMGIDIFLEAGPNPTLAGLAKQNVSKETALLLSSGRKGRSDWNILLDTLQQLYLSDVDVNWKAVYEGTGGQIVSLPTYPWQKQEYWYDPVKEHSGANASAPGLNIEVSSGNTLSKDNLMDVMQQVAVGILGLKKGSKLDAFKSMREQGFDSMMSGEFLAVMEKYLGAKLEMSLIHVYGDLNSLHNYFIKEILGGDETITMSDVMFDTGAKSVTDDDDDDWHNIKESDGKLMRWFKKIDKKLSVSD